MIKKLMKTVIVMASNVVLKDVEMEALYDPLCVKIKKEDLLYPGVLMDLTSKYFGCQSVFKAKVEDHNDPKLSVHDILAQVNQGRLKESRQVFEEVSDGFVGVHFPQRKYLRTQHRNTNWNISERLPELKKTKNCYKTKYYFIDCMTSDESLQARRNANFPDFTITDDTLAQVLKESEGLTIPYYYIGESGTIFGGHFEDHAWPSVNYVLSGIKIWYFLSSENADEINKLAYLANGKRFGQYTYDNCKDCFNHRNLFISPQILRDHQIPFKVIIQKAGEVLFLGPNVWHAGYNLTDCAAVALNCTSGDWLGVGKEVEQKLCREADHNNPPKCDEEMLEEIRQRQQLRTKMVSRIFDLSESFRDQATNANPCDVRTGTIHDEICEFVSRKPVLKGRRNTGKFKSRFAKNRDSIFIEVVNAMKNDLSNATQVELNEFSKNLGSSIKLWAKYSSEKHSKALFLKQKFMEYRNIVETMLLSLNSEISLIAIYRNECKFVS